MHDVYQPGRNIPAIIGTPKSIFLPLTFCGYHYLRSPICTKISWQYNANKALRFAWACI